MAKKRQKPDRPKRREDELPPARAPERPRMGVLRKGRFAGGGGFAEEVDRRPRVVDPIDDLPPAEARNPIGRAMPPPGGRWEDRVNFGEPPLGARGIFGQIKDPNAANNDPAVLEAIEKGQRPFGEQVDRNLGPFMGRAGDLDMLNEVEARKQPPQFHNVPGSGGKWTRSPDGRWAFLPDVKPRRPDQIARHEQQAAARAPILREREAREYFERIMAGLQNAVRRGRISPEAAEFHARRAWEEYVAKAGQAAGVQPQIRFRPPDQNVPPPALPGGVGAGAAAGGGLGDGANPLNALVGAKLLEALPPQRPINPLAGVQGDAIRAMTEEAERVRRLNTPMLQLGAQDFGNNIQNAMGQMASIQEGNANRVSANKQAYLASLPGILKAQADSRLADAAIAEQQNRANQQAAVNPLLAALVAQVGSVGGGDRGFFNRRLPAGVNLGW